MQIENCTIKDMDAILKLNEAARSLQTAKKMVVWPLFEKQFIENDIFEQRQWKVLTGGEIACTWAITFNDKEIWGSRDKDAIYIHRIATNPAFRGNNFVEKIVSWARGYALENKKKFIRLDTLGNNTKLIEHYTKSGFSFLGIERLADVRNLPAHYQKEPDCCLFEIVL